MIHHHKLRVYYEDTDMAGIVYYANYLKFLERGRTEMVRALGVDQVAMKAQGLVFVVTRVEADYRSVARYDDQLLVETRFGRITGASFIMDQRVLRDETVILEASVRIACMSLDGKVQRIPAEIRQKLDKSGV